MSNLGCATTANLGAMMADPATDPGRTPGAADAKGSAGAIQRYRAGKIRPLQKLTTDGGAVGRGRGQMSSAALKLSGDNRTDAAGDLAVMAFVADDVTRQTLSVWRRSGNGAIR